MIKNVLAAWGVFITAFLFWLLMLKPPSATIAELKASRAEAVDQARELHERLLEKNREIEAMRAARKEDI